MTTDWLKRPDNKQTNIIKSIGGLLFIFGVLLLSLRMVIL